MSKGIFTLSESSTKEEVQEYLCNSLNLKDDAKNLILGEYLSGDVLHLLTLEELKSIGFKLGPAKKIDKLLGENKEKFKEKEINVKIFSNSNYEEIKNFFEKYIDFKGELNPMIGKDLLELNEEGMKKIGLKYGQRKRLLKYIKYFKTLQPKVEESDEEISISRTSNEEDVSKFLKLKMKFSQEAIKNLELDGESFFDLKDEEINKITELSSEEKERLKKLLNNLKNSENQGKNEPEKELKIKGDSSNEEVCNFLKKKLDLSDNAISIIKEQDLDGESFLDLTEENIKLINGLTEQDIEKLKKFIIENKIQKSENELVIDIKSSKEEVSKFLKNKLNFSENALKEWNLDGKTLLSLKEADIENIKEISKNEKNELKIFLLNYHQSLSKSEDGKIKQEENNNEIPNENEKEKTEKGEIKINKESKKEDIIKFLEKYNLKLETLTEEELNKINDIEKNEKDIIKAHLNKGKIVTTNIDNNISQNNSAPESLQQNNISNGNNNTSKNNYNENQKGEEKNNEANKQNLDKNNDVKKSNKNIQKSSSNSNQIHISGYHNNQQNNYLNQNFPLNNQAKEKSSLKIFFSAIIEFEYSKKIIFFIKLIIEQPSKDEKLTSKTIHLKPNAYQFTDRIISKWYYSDTKFKRTLFFFDFEISNEYDCYQIGINLDKKEYLSRQVKIVNLTNNVIIQLKPFNLTKPNWDNILFDLGTEEDKNSFFCSLINYFKGKESDQKKEFIEEYLKDTIINPSKKFEDIFSLVNIFNNNFLDINFNSIFNNLEKFELEKSFYLTKEMKRKINKLFDDIKAYSNKEMINLNIWPFIILLLIKYQENNKILDIFAMIEKLNNKEKIIAKLFSLIKKLINKIPEIKEYFVYIIRYQPTELNFMIDNIKSYEKYLDLIFKNMEHLKNNIYNIFPRNLIKTITNSDNNLHTIIKIIKDNKNCEFDCQIFKSKFGKQYLKSLSSDEKKILYNFISNKNYANDISSLEIINDLEIDNIKYCKDNNILINILEKQKITDEILELCANNMDLENLSDPELKHLNEILKKHFKIYNNGKRIKIYLIYFQKIKNLRDFIKIITIFGFCTFEDKDINAHINKFWKLFNSEKNYDKQNVLSFFYVFLLINKNNEEKTLEFLKKINEIETEEYIINIYEKILKKKESLNDEQKKIISNFYITRAFEEKYYSLQLDNTYSFLLEYFDDQIIEIDDFYKNTKEISGIFRIFNYLNQKKEFRYKNFYKNSTKNFDEFLSSFDKNEITFLQLITLKDLVKTSEFNEKIKYFDFTEEKKNNFFKEIESKFNNILDIKTKLEACQKYLDLFPSSENSKLKYKIAMKINEIKNPLNKFIKSIKEKNFFEKLEQLFERSIKYKEIKTLKVSAIFITELENKVDKEIEKISYLENRINEMRKIFSLSSIKDIDKSIFEEFLFLFENENELKNEISIMEKYFKMTNIDLIIEKYLIYKYKYLKLINTLNNLIAIINQFNLTKTTFFEKINDLKNKIVELNVLEKDFNENKLDEENKKLNDNIFNFESIDNKLNFKIIPMDIVLFLVNKFQENSLLTFLFDLTINDLRDITNSLSGSSLDINDINDYQFILAIINSLKEKVGLIVEQEENNKDTTNSNNEIKKNQITDVEFMKMISIEINEKLNGKTQEEFKLILKKCSQNKPKLLLLFENKKGFESSKEDIRNIINESTIEIYDDNENYSKNIYAFDSRYNCRCIYQDQTKEKYLKELIVLQQLASLSQNKEKEDENKLLNEFIDLIENLKEILIIIDKIIYKGFPEEFYYRINIKKGEATCKNMNIELDQTKSLSEEKISLKKLLGKISDSQIEAYKQTKFLKFFYGQQLTMFNNYLKTKRGNSKIKNEVRNLLHYIIGNKFDKDPSNFVYQSGLSYSKEFKLNDENDYINNKAIRNLKSEDVDLKINPADDTSSDILKINKNTKNNKTNIIINFIKKSNTNPIMKQGNEKELKTLMDDMYKNVEKYLNEIMLINGINERDIFEKSLIKEKYEKNKGLYIFNAGQNIYKYILKFYYCFVGNDPPRFMLMLCNEETTLEEFISFLYLAKYCPYHSLFIIAKPDKLNLDIIYEIESILEDMHKNEKSINSFILFLFNDIGKSEIGKELLKICQSAEEPKEDSRMINQNQNEINTTTKIENENYYKNIEVVKSDVAGYGKTFYIKRKCVEKGLKYISFPIGGEMRRKTIMRRLKELNLVEKNIKYGLHLDVSDTKQIELLEDFIFSFLIQKFYSNNENIFCYEDNVIIFIEIQNGFIKLMEKYKLLHEFKIHNIDKLEEFKLQEDKNCFKDYEDMKKDQENKNNPNYENEKLNHNYLYKSDIQLVCNYLKNLKEMSRKNIFFYNLIEKSKEKLGYDYYINAKYIDEKECHTLLESHFKKEHKSYHQIYIYIKVLADQLRRFSINCYLMVENLYCNRLSRDIRSDIIQAFLDLTNFFTIGAFDKIVSEQISSINNNDYNDIQYDEEKDTKKASDKLGEANKNITFQELNDKGFIFVNNDGQSLTIITCAPKNSNIYKKFEKLLNSGAKFGDDKNIHLSLPDFTKMEKNEEYLEIIKAIIDSKENIQAIKKKLGSYVFNEDNFFKMVQILLRLRAGIPVLLMGETGCGKTSLINAVALINNYEIIPFNIHAGITDNEIVQFLSKNNLLDGSIGYDEFEGDVDQLYKYNNDEDSSSFTVVSNQTDNKDTFLHENEKNKDEKNIDKSKKKNGEIIVFFDEFNTCNSLGLLTEIMCSRRCQGVEIKKNVRFVGACNPYRKLKKRKAEFGEYESTALIKKDSPISKKDLVYTVNPLTFTQLYYIFNFGSLTEDNEKKYITGIVESEVDEFIEDKNISNEIKKIMINSFIVAQSDVRKNMGNESVSMRETRKFMTIYKFLIKDFKRKCQLSDLYSKKSPKEREIDENNYEFYSDKNEMLGHKFSISTAIYICFYIRLTRENIKLEFRKKMNNLFGLDFLGYPNQLKDELLSNIKLEKGIAPNESLKLNLFVCFIGILTRIAVFLVGPPGCSKTLCFNLLKKEMKGNLSKSKFWKEYPQLIVTSYQGSLTSTSKGIIDTFEDGKKKLKDYLDKNKNKTKKNANSDSISECKKNLKEKQNNDKGIIVCIYIDEIGLCELSPSNPLKALHTYLELEYQNQNIEKKTAFVGISNWQLDAAKMNRGIFLNVLNPISDLNQLKETAYKITDIYDKTFSITYKKLLDDLVSIIYEYNNELKASSSEQIFFHGARDFYNLIKTVTKKILENSSEKLCDEKNKLKSALFAIESNYNGIIRDGKNSSSDEIKNKFKDIYAQAKDIPDFGLVECIKNNLESDDSRYLLLIMKSNLNQYLVLNILKNIKEDNKIIYYLGSLFEDDIYNEAYSAKSINKIKFYLEHDIILVLKNLSTTYSSLYDLFNQRFSYIKNKKFAEISLGEVSNSSYVNDGLKIIVLIREEMVKEQDPPFLNRFEKYYASFDNILNANGKKVAEKIMKYKKLFKKKNGNINIKYNFENELINFYEEEIKSLISEYIIKSENKEILNEDEIFEHIFKKLSKTFSQELIAYINYFRTDTYNEEVKKINKFYSNSVHSSLEILLKKTITQINIIYTFTPTVRSTKFYFEVENELIGKINGVNIKYIYINLIKTERQLEIEISDFYDSENKLMIINFEESDSSNLEFVLTFLERIKKEKNSENQRKKIFIILIHLQRKKEPYNLDIFTPNLSGYEQTFIDNLFGKDILISNIINQSIKELYANTKLINVHELFNEELFYCFQKIEYQFQDNTIEKKKSHR